MPELVSPEEELPRTFIDDYKEWGIEATDAVPEYHELSAAILLSAFAAGNLQIPTTYGNIVPNLWGLILGDSTLTRKTTAMRMAMDLIYDIDQEILLATDGSAEGLLTGLSLRPGRTSIFYKDEVSGFIDSINKKDYLAGMPETLTHLYDVPPIFTRRLRKDTITISSPVFIFFGGGIRDKVYSLLTDEYILSGFLPRFLIVSGESDTSKIRATGPALTTVSDKRDKLKEQLADVYESYRATTSMQIAGQEIDLNTIASANLSDKAWKLYAKIEMDMVQAAQDSPLSILALPTFERLSRSLLKLSALIASSYKRPDEGKLEVTESDVKVAASYIQKWGRHSIEAISKSGRSTTQKMIDKVLSAIEKNPGIPRSKIMQHYHLTKREADEVLNTLEDRGQITIQRKGRASMLYAN